MRNAQINTLRDIQSVSRPGMDKPANRLTQKKQFRVQDPIGAICTRHTILEINFYYLGTILQL